MHTPRILLALLAFGNTSLAISATNTEDSRIQIGIACSVQVAPRVPRKAVEEGITGTVVTEIRIVSGEVSEVKILSGPDVYRDSVVTAIKQYKCEERISAVANQEFTFKIEDAEPIHTLRENPKFLGITFQTVLGNAKSNVPFDKPYGALSTDEKAMVRSDYTDLAADDEPPYPLEGLKALFDPIGQGLGYVLKGESVYEGRLEVDEQGIPLSMTTLKSPNNSTTRFIARIAMLTKFKPGLCNGSPCRKTFIFRTHLKVG